MQNSGIEYKSVDVCYDDLDFINQVGLIVNDTDELAVFYMYNKERTSQFELEECVFDMYGSPITGRMYSKDEDFWIKLCTSSEDHTVHPHVFSAGSFYIENAVFNNPSLAELVVNQDEDLKKEPIVKSSDIWLHLCSSKNATVMPATFSFEKVRRSAGIFYKSDNSLYDIINQIMREENTGMTYIPNEGDNGFTPMITGM